MCRWNICALCSLYRQEYMWDLESAYAKIILNYVTLAQKRKRVQNDCKLRVK